MSVNGDIVACHGATEAVAAGASVVETTETEVTEPETKER